MTDTEIPRRIDLRRQTEAEAAIRAAIEKIERLEADVRLTAAVVLLDQALDRVADFVDGVSLPVAETRFPGLKSGHQMITPECRINRGSMRAFDEAARRLRDTYGNYVEAEANAGVTWHLALVRNDPAED